ncbi:DUF2219 family protein [Pseudorhodobacter sp. E13]|uniref:lipid A-modifier LpxR family protein n=1 Tax=Pseudorhodobacter sp. E13 TaxID=2487931 RepID=UPI000F8F13D8|nr:lipid A-modifier LpxR family protein [Pseudorhodobacter sp. E13]RUS59819.1 DUF2219 family protein [Pseudorhodobacter sp. E13]
MRKALTAIAAALLSLPLLAQPLAAQDHKTLGFGRFFNNDALGDGKDRWRTGSYALSIVRGQGWDGVLPNQIGALLEYRLRTEIIAPENLAKPAAMDRRYVGAFSAGLHSHFARGAVDMRVGLDVVATGPQTGVGKLQRQLHKIFGMATPGDLSMQIPNHVYPTLSAELSRSYDLGPAHLRPFAEAQAGVETYLRVGGDISFGSFGQGSLMLRDQVTGHRFTGVQGDAGQGFSFTLGGDVARVFDTAYLPDGGSVTSSDARGRLRAGVNWRGEKSQIFYGVTHLGSEFKEQKSGQTLGSLRLHIRF